jgi:hypothetical protein
VNEATATLFDEFATAYRRGDAPDVVAYIERAGDDADALADLIDRFLEAVPAREPTEEEIVLMHARLERQPPILLLRLRRAYTRDAVVDTLMRILGLDPAKRAKVNSYYHGLEVGTLDPAPVDSRVWDVLGDVLKANVRRLADWVPPSSPAAPAPAFRRLPNDAPRYLASIAPVEGLTDRLEAVPEPEPPDEVDRLFTGSA